MLFLLRASRRCNNAKRRRWHEINFTAECIDARTSSADSRHEGKGKFELLLSTFNMRSLMKLKKLGWRDDAFQVTSFQNFDLLIWFPQLSSPETFVSVNVTHLKYMSDLDAFQAKSCSETINTRQIASLCFDHYVVK